MNRTNSERVEAALLSAKPRLQELNGLSGVANVTLRVWLNPHGDEVVITPELKDKITR